MVAVSSLVLLAATLESDPGKIVGPISKLFGIVLNFIFNIVYSITPSHSMGISIILLTIFVRILMIPLAVKQQKSMFVMRKLQPEMRKIQDKYKDMLEDPEAKRKMNMEMQGLYTKFKYNPFSGCLPMIIQLPIFIGLYYVMRNPYQFIDEIYELYKQIGNVFIENASFESMQDFAVNIVKPMLPQNDVNINILNVDDLVKVLDKLNAGNWEIFKGYLPDGSINSLLERKDSINAFLGLNLSAMPDEVIIPNIAIPIISGFTTYLSGWLMTRKNQAADPAVKTQQRIMNITMPLFMAYVTFRVPCGVGLYWTTSNVFQIVQYMFLNKHYEKRMSEEGTKM